MPSYSSSSFAQRISRQAIEAAGAGQFGRLHKEALKLIGRRYILVVFDDRPVGLLSHADGSRLFPEARSKLIALSWEEIRLALMLDIGSN